MQINQGELHLKCVKTMCLSLAKFIKPNWTVSKTTAIEISYLSFSIPFICSLTKNCLLKMFWQTYLTIPSKPVSFQLQVAFTQSETVAMVTRLAGCFQISHVWCRTTDCLIYVRNCCTYCFTLGVIMPDYHRSPSHPIALWKFTRVDMGDLTIT